MIDKVMWIWCVSWLVMCRWGWDVTVDGRGEGQIQWRVDASRLGLRDWEVRAESWAIHMLHGRARVHGWDEDSIARAKRKAMVSSSRLPMRGVQKTWRRRGTWWRPDTRRYREGRNSKRRWTVWVVGPQNHHARRLPGLGRKTWGVSCVAGWRRWRTRGIITKVASRRSYVMKVACPSTSSIKGWTILPLEGIWVVCVM